MIKIKTIGESMHANVKQQKTETKALNISLLGGAVFALLELGMALYTHSQAVLLDSIYDGIELIMILISLSIIPLLYRSANEKHPFGFLQVETLFVALKGVTMVAVTIGLIFTNIEIVLQGGRKIAFSQIAYFELFACILGLIIILLLKRMNQKMNSPIVAMEIQEWRIDVVASIGMAIAFFLPIFFSDGPFARFIPYFDQLIAIALSIFMLPTPIRAIISGLRDLFLVAPEEETVEQIKSIITPILDAYGYKKLHFDIIRTGRKLWISVYITFEKDEISISRFAIVQEFVIQALLKEYSDFYFELLPDIEYHKSQNSIDI
ncbi:cation transporter [Lachnospiraceae bacterium LCP25S3_G4]